MDTGGDGAGGDAGGDGGGGWDKNLYRIFCWLGNSEFKRACNWQYRKKKKKKNSLSRAIGVE